MSEAAEGSEELADSKRARDHPEGGGRKRG